jgi:hypothetical protein
MATSYNTYQIKKHNDGYAAVLESLQATLHESGVHFIQNIGDVLQDETLFQTYKKGLLSGVAEGQVEDLSQMIDNARVVTIQESGLEGIRPISGLNGLMVRKLWPRTTIKDALQTEVAKFPKFSVGFLKPFVLRDGVKTYLPEGLTASSNLAKGTSLYGNVIKLANAAYTDSNVAGSQNGAGTAAGFALLTVLPAGTTGISVAANDTVDADFRITHVEMSVTDTGGLNPETVTVAVNPAIVPGLDGAFSAVVSGAHSDTTVNTDNILGSLDRQKGILRVVSTAGKVTGVKVRGFVSAQNLSRSDSVGFDNAIREITIGDGTPVTAPLKSQFAQDNMALFKIDAATKLVETMTNVVGLRLDQEMAEFVKDSHAVEPTYTATFNVQPPANFHSGPSAWLNELKRVVDHLCARIRRDRSFGAGGTFTIVGNDIDANLIPGVDWKVKGAANVEVSGVSVNYNIGYISSAAGNIKVVSSPQMAEGSLYILFTSMNDDEITYKYYPYSFSVESNYRDPQMPNVPAMAAFKRHTIERFSNAIAKITIQNNTGSVFA